MSHGCTPDPWTDRLSDYLDGELGTVERRRLEQHLDACGDCRTLLDELRAVVGQASALATDSEPEADLWPGIAPRLAPRRRAGWRWVFGTPSPGRRLAPALAALVLVLVAAGLAWLLRRPAAVTPGPEVAHSVAPVPSPQAPSEEYDDTVAHLRRTVETRLTADPQLLTVIDRNLQSINTAIADYSDALAGRPGDARLRQRLEEARSLKLEMLRQAASLAPGDSN